MRWSGTPLLKGRQRPVYVCAHVTRPRTSAQAAVGRTLLDLSRIGGLAEHIATVSPDVSGSTNLGGWINKVGVYGHEESPVYRELKDAALGWRVSPSGQHVDLGVSEMDLLLALEQLGMTSV